jgi:hypothetical protein
MRRTATPRDLALLTAVALAVLAGTFAITWSRADDASAWDVPLYESFGDAIVDGSVPYRDLRIEYPPGALPAFVLPALASRALGPGGPSVYEPDLNDAAWSYAFWFAALMGLLLAVTLVTTAVSLRALGAAVGRAAAALLTVGATPLLLGELALTRFDALPVALTAAATALLLVRRPRWAALALGLAVAAKLYPLLLLPLFAALAWRRHGRREAWVGVGLTVAVVAAAFLPFLALAPADTWFSVRAQTTRGLQVESLAGSVVLAVDRVAEGLGLSGIASVDEGGTGSVRSADVVGAAGTVVGTLGMLASLLVIAAVWIGFARGDGSPAAFVRAAAAVVAAQLALGRVLSPQFVLWLLPFVPLVRGRRGQWALGLLVAATAATHVWFPDLYRDYVNEREPLATAFLLGRNALLLALLAVLVLPPRGGYALRGSRSPSSPPAASSTNAGANGTE